MLPIQLDQSEAELVRAFHARREIVEDKEVAFALAMWMGINGRVFTPRLRTDLEHQTSFHKEQESKMIK